MNPQSLIDEIKEDYIEWLEMADNPDAMVSGILAKKIIKLNDHIEYLEKRIKSYERSSLSDTAHRTR